MDELVTRHLPYDPGEITWARWRPARHRTPIPAVGERVLYRATEWADPVDAIVLEVSYTDSEHIDWNCWRVRTNPDTTTPIYDDAGEMVLDPHPDAWPTLLLKVDGQASHVQTREARLRGSTGWLPSDWRQRQRPVPGREMPR
jgi:hypothetical protein